MRDHTVKRKTWIVLILLIAIMLAFGFVTNWVVVNYDPDYIGPAPTRQRVGE